MKTCIKYWGGKQQLVPKLLPLIPAHFTYCEPFFGGGALFFAKPPSKNEVINDINDNMVNFYRVLKRATTFEQLTDEIDLTLYSEWQYRQAKELWQAGMDKDKILRAWAVVLNLRYISFCGCVQFVLRIIWDTVLFKFLTIAVMEIRLHNVISRKSFGTI